MEASRTSAAGREWSPAVAFALLALALELVALPRYGWFRDELYYLTCADHLAWGYVDQPPFSIAVLALVRAAFGDALWAVRLAPALCFAGLVFLTVRFARRLGGGPGGQALAGLAMVGAPVLLGTAHVFSMNAIEQLLWTASGWALVDALERRGHREWIVLGALLGVGLLDKISVSWWIAGLLVGLLASRERRALLSPGPWIAAAIAAALFLPHLLWQVANGWPTLEFMRHATQHKMVDVSAAALVTGQLQSMGPATAPVWLIGLVVLLRSRRAPWARVFGVAWLVVVAIIAVAGRSRASYLSPAYPVLFAAGGAAIDGFFARRGWRWATPAVAALIGLLSAPLVPLALPVLPVERFIAYQRALGLAPSTEEHHAMGELPQYYADMFGWQEMGEKVARAYRSLPAAERAKAAIFAQNYGEAGAIDLYGRAHGLPPALSGHNNYWLWGPRGYDGSVVVILGGDAEDNRAWFDRVALVDTVAAPYAMPYERGLGIFVAHGMRLPLAEAWPRLKQYQ